MLVRRLSCREVSLKREVLYVVDGESKKHKDLCKSKVMEYSLRLK